jgi:hypothetical protein
MNLKPKKFSLFSFALLLTLVSLLSCDSQEPMVSDESALKQTDKLQEILDIGFQRSDIQDMGDYYLAEGDIYFSKDDSGESKGVNGRKEQASTNNLVSYQERTNITVKIDGSIPSSGVDDWRNEILQAIDHWNSIADFGINLVYITSGTADITVQSDNGSLPDYVIAAAEFPSGGLAGYRVRINLDFSSNMTVSSGSKVYNMVHEFGHCVGFRHTNWASQGEPSSPYGANQIPGTPASDNSSVMNGGTALNSWAGFSTYDIIGAQNLYPRPRLYIVQGASLYGVNVSNGEWAPIGTSTWANSRVMTNVNGLLYIVQDPGLYRASAKSASWSQVGTADWSGTNIMTNQDGYLYMVQTFGLYRTVPGTGSYARVGTGDWTGSSAMTADNQSLYIVQSYGLYKVNPSTGTWVRLGTADWTGTSLLASMGGYLYAVQGAGLYRIDPNTGSYISLNTSDWTGSNLMSAHDGYLYIVQSPGLYRVNVSNGSYVTLSPSSWAGSTAMTTF